MCLFPSCLTFIAVWGGFWTSHCQNLHKTDLAKKLLITICRTYMAVRTSGYITFFIGTPVGNTCIQHLYRPLRFGLYLLIIQASNQISPAHVNFIKKILTQTLRTAFYRSIFSEDTSQKKKGDTFPCWLVRDPRVIIRNVGPIQISVVACLTFPQA